VIGGQGLLRFVNVRTIRRVTAVLLFILAALALIEAVR
jgi:putative Ca2+/H+ antiporter (TMEM165/GDT1 family)